MEIAHACHAATSLASRRSKPESRPPEPEQNRLCPDVGNRIGIDALAFSSVPQNQIVIRRKRLRFGEEPRQNVREVTFAKKIAANDMPSAATWCRKWDLNPHGIATNGF